MSKTQKKTRQEQAHDDMVNQSRNVTAQVTAETINASVHAGIGALGAAFYELEQRCVADNGKAYPHNASLPEGVADTGEVVDVNKFAFLQRQLTSVVCWKLEQMLDNADSRIVDQRKRIASMLRLPSVTEQQIERVADFLEVLIEQRAMVQVAFDASLDGYEAATGEQFETKAMRDQRERAVKDTPRTAQSARLAALGVNV